MKKHYKKELPWRATEAGETVYCLRWGGYCRRVRTYPELRRNYGDWNDFRDEPHVKGIRRRRGMSTLNAWNDFSISRTWKKSWKDFTKHRKQWMVGDADIEEGEPSEAFLRIMAGLEEVANILGVTLDTEDDNES